MKLSLSQKIRGYLPLFGKRRKMFELVKEKFKQNNCYQFDSERKRLYKALKWRIGTVQLSELGVWDCAQGMPHEWCVGNVVETAKHYRSADNHEGEYCRKIQVMKTMSNLPPIIAVDGRTQRGREECGELKWHIDDGCMRAVTEALKGKGEITGYLGTM